MLLTGVIVNPLSSTIREIRKASETSFESGFELLDRQDQFSVLCEIEVLATSLFEKMRKQTKSVDDIIDHR
jgi:hypothetical protein